MQLKTLILTGLLGVLTACAPMQLPTVEPTLTPPPSETATAVSEATATATETPAPTNIPTEEALVYIQSIAPYSDEVPFYGWPGITFQPKIFVLNSVGGNLKKVSDFIPNHEEILTNMMVASPDGHKIAFLSDVLSVIDLNTGKELRVSLPQGYVYNYAYSFVGVPAWSPDSQSLALVAQKVGSRSEILIWNLADSSVNPLPSRGICGFDETRNEQDIAPAWSPDGNWLAFAHLEKGPVVDTGAYYPLCLINIHDGNGQIIANDMRVLSDRINRSHINQPAWSPDGQWLAYVAGDPPKIRLINLQTNESHWLTNQQMLELYPTWSPDSKSLLFTSRLFVSATAYESPENQKNEIYLAQLDSLDLINISQDVEADDYWPTWSPSGDYIAFISNRRLKSTTSEDYLPIGYRVFVVELTTKYIWWVSKDYSLHPIDWAVVSGR